MSPFVNKETGTFPTKVSFQIQRSVCLKFHVSDRKISISLKFAEQWCGGEETALNGLMSTWRPDCQRDLKAKEKATLSLILSSLCLNPEPGCWAGAGPAVLFPWGPRAFIVHHACGRRAQPMSPDQIPTSVVYIPFFFLTWWWLEPGSELVCVGLAPLPWLDAPLRAACWCLRQAGLCRGYFTG